VNCLPVGAALGGAIGEWFGLRRVFVIMGLVTIAVLIPNHFITEESLAEADEL
jgi:predicted MFS family arabinose efflux permease